MLSQKEIEDKMNEQKALTNTYNRIFKVEISKSLMVIFNIFGWTNFIGGIVLAYLNVDVFTRSVMQLLGCLFILFKIIQMVDNWWHKRAMNKLERRSKELEIMMNEDKYLRSHNFNI